ncbi:MAG: hypothetical protein WC709_02595 [Thermoleophilia bacterium]
MSFTRPLRFALVALGTIILALLTFAVSVAQAATTPSTAFQWPVAGPGGTASTVMTAVSLVVVAAGAIVYGSIALRRSGVAEIPALRVVPGEREPERLRKAA